MSLTIRYITGHKHIGVSITATGGQPFPPMNFKFILDDNVEIKVVSANAIGLIPYPTHLVPVLSPAGVPMPLTYLSAEHNLNLGTDRLIFVPPTGFGHATLTGLLAASANNAAIAQAPPNVNPWGVNGNGAGAPAPRAQSPPPPAAPAHAAFSVRAPAPARPVLSAQSVGATRGAWPANLAAALTAAAVSSLSASSSLTASSASSASSASLPA